MVRPRESINRWLRQSTQKRHTGLGGAGYYRRCCCPGSYLKPEADAGCRKPHDAGRESDIHNLTTGKLLIQRRGLTREMEILWAAAESDFQAETARTVGICGTPWPNAEKAVTRHHGSLKEPEPEPPAEAEPVPGPRQAAAVAAVGRQRASPWPCAPWRAVLSGGTTGIVRGHNDTAGIAHHDGIRDGTKDSWRAPHMSRPSFFGGGAPQSRGIDHGFARSRLHHHRRA
jgi:hypothetical protein